MHSGKEEQDFWSLLSLTLIKRLHIKQSLYHVGPNGWKKLSGDDVDEP
ncbi:unnamed protein product [Brassica oleracea var. botrytis]